MSVSNRLDLWTSSPPIWGQKIMDAWKPENLSSVETVSVPFYYWTTENRNNLPCYANMFDYGNYPLRPNRDNGDAADLIGRISIQISKQEGEDTTFDMVKASLRQINKLFAKREGYSHLLFKAVIPFSTRSLIDTFKSLFPFIGAGRAHLVSKDMDTFESNLLIGSIMLIADVVTLPFRLLSLIPRAFYQHGIQQNIPIEGITIEAHLPIDWSKGTVIIPTYDRQMDSDGKLNESSAPRAFYLGS